MFPTPDEIKKATQIELAYMLAGGHEHGEIDISFPQYGIEMIVFVKDGKMDHAKITKHPKGIRPRIRF